MWISSFNCDNYFLFTIQYRFHLVDRKSKSVVAIYSVEPFFCFHQVNAYESESNEIILDSCMYPDASVIDNLYLSEIKHGHMVDAFPAQLRRYRLPIDGISNEHPMQVELKKYETGLDFELLHPSFEMPKINYDAFNGKKYKYTFGLGYSTIKRGLSTLLKVLIYIFTLNYAALSLFHRHWVLSFITYGSL